MNDRIVTDLLALALLGGLWLVFTVIIPMMAVWFFRWKDRNR